MRTFGNRIDVQVNGLDLKEGEDYFWMPGFLVLKKSRPRPPELTWWQKVKYAVTFDWHELTRDRFPYPDLVVIENWEMCERDVFLFGTPDFDRHIRYEEDLANIPDPPEASDEG